MIPGYDTGPVEDTPEDRKAEDAFNEYHDELEREDGSKVKPCCPDYSSEKTKDTNPKDAIGCKKPPLSMIPWPVIFELGVAMLEGACKYRRHNYRIAGVRASIYFDAAWRHLADWYEGQDIDPDSGLHHVTKAIASLVVLRDAMMNNKLIDDRPPASSRGWMKRVQELMDDVLARYPNPRPPYTNDPDLEIGL